MEIEEEKHLGAPMLLTIVLVCPLIPKREDLQGAGPCDTKHPSRTIMLYEWTLVTLPVQIRVSSRKSHKLPKARTHESISPSLWRSLWPPHLLAGVCWHPSGSRYGVTGAHLYYCHIYITDKSSCQLYQRALKS